MSKAVFIYNGLNGAVEAAKIQEIADLAKEEGQTHLFQRLTAGLEEAKNLDAVEFHPGRLAFEQIPSFDLPGMEPLPNYIDADDFTGLNKAVSPDDIYQYITDLMLNTIKEVGHLPWQRTWDKSGFSKGFQATNFESKKGYRGINFFLLNFKVELDKNGEQILVSRITDNPYFLTFNQITKFKGKLKKGSKGIRVVYFTMLYSYSEVQADGKKLEFSTYNQKKFKAWIIKNQAKLKILKRPGWNVDRLSNSYIPILKYYNVFQADDITGIDWGEIPKNENADKSDKEKIEIAEAIIQTMPNPPQIKFGGNQPAYYPGTDSILSPPIDKFHSPQEYYSTMFHELVHSTGHKKRLSRPGITLGALGTKLDYAREELVAEMGAVFLCAESGILFHVIDNSAKYLRGWNSRLVKSMKEDNRFYFRAASAAQAAADYMLDRDKEGIPKYRKATKKKTTAAATPKKKEVTRKKKPKAVTNPTLFDGLAGTINISTEEFNNFSTSELRNFILHYYNQNLKGQIIPIKNSLHKVQLVNSAGRKISKGSAVYKAKTAVIEHFEEVLKNSTYNNWGDRKSKDSPELLGYMNFKSKVNIDGNKRHVRVSVQVFKDRQTLLKSYEIGNKKPHLSQESQKLSSSPNEVLNNKVTKSKPKTKKNGLKSPDIEPKPTEGGQSCSGESPRPLISGRHPKVQSIKSEQERSPMFDIDGETSKFLQAVEKKPIGSVVVTLDGEQGAGKTTAVYKFQNDFATAGNRCLWASLEEHPTSNLAQEKRDQYLSPEAQKNIDTVAEFDSYEEFCEIVKDYDAIFIDSWQKLLRMIGTIRLDEDLRRKFDGKVFFIIFQQTTEGRTKGGAEIVFDGDIIIKLKKMPSFSENFAYFDKNRYTTVPIEDLKYMILEGVCIDDGQARVTPEPEILANTPENEEKFDFEIY